MKSILVMGGKKLYGEVTIQGSKNTALPILAATLLIDGVCKIENCPHLMDVDNMLVLMRNLGCRVLVQDRDIYVDSRELGRKKLEGAQVSGMRSSITLLGALLGRMGYASIGYPGGCVIGERPIDLHQSVLEKMDVHFEKNETGLIATTSGLYGNDISFYFPSVGATENVILAAVLAEGKTVIYGAAKEPEIIYLCDFLCKAGAEICGAGTDCITITGVKRLYDANYRIPPDRIVAGTYFMCVMATGGSVLFHRAPMQEMKALTDVLLQMGGEIVETLEGVVVRREQPLKPVHIKTEVYPGFPTDLQSMMLVLLTQGTGTGSVEETIFENRFRIVPQLEKMGADIILSQNKAKVAAYPLLLGTTICAQELRGNAALVMAGLVAQGETLIENCEYVQRGYEDICRDIRLMGGDLKWINIE